MNPELRSGRFLCISDDFRAILIRAAKRPKFLKDLLKDLKQLDDFLLPLPSDDPQCNLSCYQYSMFKFIILAPKYPNEIYLRFWNGSRKFWKILNIFLKKFLKKFLKVCISIFTKNDFQILTDHSSKKLLFLAS